MIDYKGFSLYLKEQELSDNTVEAYICNLKEYEKFGGNFTKESMIDFKWKMLEKKSAKTVNHYISALSKYCKYVNLPFDVKRIKVQKQTTVENVMSLEQYNRLIGGLEADGEMRKALYIKTIAKTGCRISEALKLKQVDFEKNYIQIYTKGKVRTIYFPESLRAEVKNYCKGILKEELLFLNKYGNPITSRGFDHILKHACVKYGIPKEVAHAHSLRHLFAVNFLKNNKNISLLADILGHSGVNTTMIYTRLSQKEQMEQFNRAVDW